MLRIETERLIIRDHIRSDLKQYHDLFSSKEEMFYLPDLYTGNLSVSESLLEESIREAGAADKRIKYFLGVFLKEGTYIGEMGYTISSHNNFREKNVHLGYFIKKEFWGKGYMTEAVKELLKFAFIKDNVIKVETGCITDNRGSEKVMLKCGFTKEAYKAKHQYLEGKWRDRVEYGLLKENF